MQSVQITIQHFDGCPHWRIGAERLEEALRIAGAQAEVTYHVIDNYEEAERHRFRGSPTFLIDGKDPFLDEETPVGLSCRVYRTDDGFEGAPSVEQLVDALASSGARAA
ncbi:MAG: thioredoxin family protein [Acidimicrobiia bacterium]